MHTNPERSASEGACGRDGGSSGGSRWRGVRQLGKLLCIVQLREVGGPQRVKVDCRGLPEPHDVVICAHLGVDSQTLGALPPDSILLNQGFTASE